MKAPFRTYTFKQQARSINARVELLRKAVKAHVAYARKHSKDATAVRAKCVNQIERALRGLKKI
jgi:hypothetical protein